MSGWIALGMLAAASLGLLWLLKVRGAMLQLGAAAMLLGGAGYAVGGRPGLSGAAASEARGQAPIPLTKFRQAFFGRFGPTEHWLLISESYARRGDTENAAKTLEAAVREHPGDPALWVGLANALTDHSGGLTPASELAFRRAIELAPGHPAPPFFLGLALARSGDPARGLALWRELLAEAPAEASWRPLVEDAIRAVEPRPRPQPPAGS
ncbi:MAG TPA: tetratricopeptide repeat protein [Sphingomicrobium sp.]|nr:tetratricopeptide repeat protein [Sphingomicrobium sp.]